jgi:hypothetical protein
MGANASAGRASKVSVVVSLTAEKLSLIASQTLRLAIIPAAMPPQDQCAML